MGSIKSTARTIGDANWTIDPKPLPGETKANRANRAEVDKTIVALQTFFEYRTNALYQVACTYKTEGICPLTTYLRSQRGPSLHRRT